MYYLKNVLKLLLLLLLLSSCSTTGLGDEAKRIENGMINQGKDNCKTLRQPNCPFK